MKKIILITGISSGFGKESATLLAKAGHCVYGTTRNNCETDPSVNVIRMDLTDTSSIKAAVETVIMKEGKIDILINNAGMHTGGPIETLPMDYVRLQMETNFIGTVTLIKEVLPYMRNSGGGTIINFSSVGGLFGLPFQGIYSAAKFAIEGFSEALRMEVRPFKIKVVLINPGDFNTNNTSNRRKYLSSTNNDDSYNSYFMSTLEVMEKGELNGGKPLKLAKKLVKIVECCNPKQRYIIGAFYEKIAVRLKYILPGRLFRWILEKNYKLR